MDQFREEIIKAIKKEIKDAEITLEVPQKPELYSQTKIIIQ